MSQSVTGLAERGIGEWSSLALLLNCHCYLSQIEKRLKGKRSAICHLLFVNLHLSLE